MNRPRPWSPGTGRWLGAALLISLLLLGLLAAAGDDREGGSGGGEFGPGSSARAEVLRVVDGDTIEVELDGSIEDVRYIGIDTPETVKPGAPVECYGKQASEFNKHLLGDGQVRLQFDRELRDRYGRMLAYVFVGETFVNGELVHGGYARTLEFEPNTARAEELGRLEQAAGESGRGLWGEC